MSEIKRVAVIGAGVMGASIAAHFANAGIPVLLLDIVPKDAVAPKGRETIDRDVIAKSVVEKMLKTDCMKRTVFKHAFFPSLPPPSPSPHSQYTLSLTSL